MPDRRTATSTAIAVIGTDTGVGKTVVSALLIEAFRQAGLSTVALKPVVSGTVEFDGEEIYADNEYLARAAGVKVAAVSIYRFPEPLSPHLAAEHAGEAINIEKIAARIEAARCSHQAVIIEGVGGALVPLTPRETFADLVARLRLRAVIVARAALGTLNHTLLTVEACRARGVEIAGIVINRYPATPTIAEETNPRELARLTGLPILGLIPELDVSVEELRLPSPKDAGRLNFELLTSDDGQAELDDETGDEALAADAAHVWHPFSAMDEYLGEEPHPLMITRADGCWLEDSNGKRYLDGVSSLWVNVHGHRHPTLDAALRKQLDKVAHSTLLGLANEPSALLAAELAEITPAGLEKVFYSDSGSTAVEVALKIAFQYHRQTGRPKKEEFISFTNAYHGDTLGAVSVGGHELFHSTFKPLLFPTHLAPAAYCYRCPVGRNRADCDLACLEPLEKLLAERADRTAAVIFEPKVQGAAGIIVQPTGYMTRLAALCRQHDVLLIADEVATGFGRTGPLFACELEDIEPDIMTVAKGITGGYLPLAATLCSKRIYEAFRGRYEELKTFFHGHTYTGNPLATAVARANIRLLRETDLLDEARTRATEVSDLLAPLAANEHVGDVRQQGLMVGIELVADRSTKEPFSATDRIGRTVSLKARERSVIIRPLGDTLVLMPPPVISPHELELLVDATTWAVGEVVGGNEH